jgi:uncharacterized membrane protein
MRPAALPHHWRLMAAGAAGLAFGLCLGWLGAGRPVALLAGWCLAAGLWLVLILPVMTRTPAKGLRARTEALDESGLRVLGAVVVALLASLGSIFFALAPQGSSRLAVTLGVATLCLAWFCVHVLFAVHYAHEHYRAGAGIVFPGNEAPDFREFLYFALTVGMTFQVSDATTGTPAVRRLVMWHAVVSFVFNAAILGAAVNLAASLAQ